MVKIIKINWDLYNYFNNFVMLLACVSFFHDVLYVKIKTSKQHFFILIFMTVTVA